MRWCYAMRCDTIRCNAMRCDETSVVVDQGEAAGGGQRGGVLAGVGLADEELDEGRRGCWSANVRRQGMDDMAGRVKCVTY
jgi:hypothetical protein